MDRVAYRAAIEELNSQPIGEDLPSQKFKRGSKVHICKDLPEEMDHFPNDFDAIVDYTYAQKFGGDDTESYCVAGLNDKGVVVDHISWYREDQLTLISDDLEAGIKLIAQYEGTDEEEE